MRDPYAMPADLDRWITGNYGEDQYREDDSEEREEAAIERAERRMDEGDM